MKMIIVFYAAKLSHEEIKWNPGRVSKTFQPFINKHNLERGINYLPKLND